MADADNSHYDRLQEAIEVALDKRGWSFLEPVNTKSATHLPRLPQVDSTDVAQAVLDAIWPEIEKLLTNLKETEDSAAVVLAGLELGLCQVKHYGLEVSDPPHSEFVGAAAKLAERIKYFERD